MRVLILKTSSMGDIIHTLPALSDAVAANPEIQFDWVVEENFAEIPHWHASVQQVIPVALRRWRKKILKVRGSSEWRSFKNEMKHHHYDCVIDAQGLMKSAWLARYVDAPTYGYDSQSVRERFATFAYDQAFTVSKDLHAVERIRDLFAQALHYKKPKTTMSKQISIKEKESKLKANPLYFKK